MATEMQSILIVDDQPANLISYEALLEDFGVRLLTAASGNEALAVLLKHDVALVLLDVQMPDMDGFEVAQLMRRSRKTQNTPIIFASAISKEQRFVFQGYQSGAVDYLAKPIEPQILRSKVRVFLELDRKNRELQASMETLRASLSEVEQLKDRNDLLLRSVGEGILGIDVSGEIMFSNPAAESSLCRPGERLEGRSVEDFLLNEPDTSARIHWAGSEIVHACSRGQRSSQQSYLFARRGDQVFPIEFTATPMMMRDGTFAGVVLVFKDITDRRAAENQLKQLAQYDTLTGLSNRNLFSAMLVKSLITVEAARHQLALMFLDLDRFKYVNDTFGHDQGDRLLQEVSLRLKACTRDTDIIARLGGDEFTVLIEATDARHAAIVVAHKIIQSISRPFHVGENEVHIGVSIGIVIYPDVQQDSYGLLRCADMAMYKAKSMGRNNFQFFTPDLQQNVSESMRLESRLRRAIDAHELSLVYQPQMQLGTGDITGFEVLLRWSPAGMDPVSPARFIPIAEETGIIVEIGDWVMRRACEQMLAWQKMGLCSPRQRMAVNLSVRQLKEHDIVERIRSVLDDTGMPPELLELEITESMLVENPDAMGAILRQLAEFGVRFSMDDFGTGYSSMAYLKRLPIQMLKIDRSFIMDIGRDGQDEAIAKGIIALAHSLNMEVVAEGVEEEEQLRFLENSGCDLLQGYWFSKPLTAEAMEIFLRNNAARIH